MVTVATGGGSKEKIPFLFLVPKINPSIVQESLNFSSSLQKLKIWIAPMLYCITLNQSLKCSLQIFITVEVGYYVTTHVKA